ncbi:MAG: FliM/FliN family flagellar motor switch protein [Campylobacterota bacterium]|nr:FliM/FliN family flagellar motor switch protein [Campylobacterota bacterium]
MASDLSNIIKSEIVSTLESLLSVTGNIDEVTLVNSEELGDEQCIKVESNFEFSGISSIWNFYIPTVTGTKFEYLMLGGISDLKDSIDDEIVDAVKEIVSTISGSITTSVNAQGFDDVSGMKFSLTNSSIVQCSEESSTNNLYKFVVSLNDETLSIFIDFDEKSLPFVELFTGVQPSSPVNTETADKSSEVVAGNSVLSSILGEDSIDNLRLLFDIKLRLSVRLGSKVCLLRDVISWDIGEIIELTQMTNEPLEILVNGVVIGDGEAVIVDGKFGIKIKHIGQHKLI